MSITASRIQIAVALADTTAAQAALDTACPGDFDVSSGGRALWAHAATPTVPAYAVAQGDLDQTKYATLATLATAAGIAHVAIGFWEGNTYTAAPQAGTLWGALEIVPVEDEE